MENNSDSAPGGPAIQQRARMRRYEGTALGGALQESVGSFGNTGPVPAEPLAPRPQNDRVQCFPEEQGGNTAIK